MARPIIEPELTNADKIIDKISLVLLMILFGVAVCSFYNLPDIIPIHFDGAGKPDSYGHKATLFLLPGMGFLLFFFMGYISKHPEWFNYPVTVTNENAKMHYRRAGTMMRLLRLCVMIIFLIILVLSYYVGAGKLSKLPNGILILIIGLAIGPTFLYLVRSFKK